MRNKYFLVGILIILLILNTGFTVEAERETPIEYPVSIELLILLSDLSPGDRDYLTLQALADGLAKDLEMTYDNYEYYRSHVNDTANRNILKCYSEGMLKIDENGNIYPDKTVTIRELLDLLQRKNNPEYPIRPEYVKKTDIPILMYHEINPLPKAGLEGLYVSRENFIEQLDTLNQEGYNTITMEQVYQHWENKVPLPEKPIVLSFDDGYLSHFNFASVEMGKRGMTGTFYIITDTIRDTTERSTQALKRLYDEGMEIGSHTVTHIDARYSTKTKISKEYKDSKEFLEKVLKTEVNHFCYPVGGTTQYAIDQLKDLDYKTGVVTAYGKANEDQGILTLKRIRILYTDTLEEFLNKIK